MVILEPMLPVAAKAFFLTLLQLSETHWDVVPVGTDLSLPMGRRVEPVPGLMLHLCFFLSKDHGMEKLDEIWISPAMAILSIDSIDCGVYHTSARAKKKEGVRVS